MKMSETWNNNLGLSVANTNEKGVCNHDDQRRQEDSKKFFI